MNNIEQAALRAMGVDPQATSKPINLLRAGLVSAEAELTGIVELLDGSELQHLLGGVLHRIRFVLALEDELFSRALDAHGGSIRATAEALGVTRMAARHHAKRAAGESEAS